MKMYIVFFSLIFIFCLLCDDLLKYNGDDMAIGERTTSMDVYRVHVHLFVCTFISAKCWKGSTKIKKMDGFQGAEFYMF